MLRHPGIHADANHHREHGAQTGGQAHRIERVGISLRCQIDQRDAGTDDAQEVVGKGDDAITASREEPTEAEMKSCEDAIPDITSQILATHRPGHRPRRCEPPSRE